MRILYLGSAGSWHCRDLQRAASRHQVEVAEHRHLLSHLTSSCALHRAGPRPLDDSDVVLVRTMDAGSLEQVVFRMDWLHQFQASGKVVVNSPRAIEVAVDKYLAIAKCRDAGLNVPETVVCQTVEDATVAYRQLGGDVVVKPLFGGEGRGIFRVTDSDAAHRAFQMLRQLNGIIYLQRFVEHSGFDLRLFVVGDQVLGMRRTNPHDWRSNVSRGASTERAEVTSELAEIARRAVCAVGANVAGVDVLPGTDGQLYLLEVNAVPGWKALAQTLDIDVAALLVDHLEKLVRRNSVR